MTQAGKIGQLNTVCSEKHGRASTITASATTTTLVKKPINNKSQTTNNNKRQQQFLLPLFETARLCTYCLTTPILCTSKSKFRYLLCIHSVSDTKKFTHQLLTPSTTRQQAGRRPSQGRSVEIWENAHTHTKGALDAWVKMWRSQMSHTRKKKKKMHAAWWYCTVTTKIRSKTTSIININ